MKYPQLKVSIPEPCHEDWNNMTPTDKGKFCDVCTKEVVDFTSKSDEEIIKHSLKHKNLCGRFHASQLDRKLIIYRKERNHWLSYAASLLFPFALFSQEAKSEIQKLPKIEQINTSSFKSLNIGSLHKQGEIASVIQNDSITIKGIVTDDTGLPLPIAYIKIQGTKIVVTNDFDGFYSLRVKRNDTVLISSLGYETVTIKIVDNQHVYNITLIAEVMGELDMMLGGVAGMVVTCSSDDYYTTPMSETEIKEKEKRTKNYFAFEKKKWKEKRAARKLARAKRKAEKN
ncbi:TonB-dependent receptor SusC [Kordia antarctica]|uniref:TonB-dependent receptor SusC n=1 Tax=Kordia antarctica TaxID=1218801 RepID=A0A7L4ZFV0_9FLAO|nr:carboxypeptidase-like regulatory domain-containing protein [Kordia antarctica]QHI34834.1 TonB-dependent receptor SusC [Kordia antarctica]